MDPLEKDITLNRYRTPFVTLTCIMLVISSFTMSLSSYVFQLFTIEYSVSAEVFPNLQITAGRIFILIMLIMLLRPFQSLLYQQWVMVICTFLLCFILLFFTSLSFYPFIFGLSKVINYLTDPWRQLFVPSQYRARVETITAVFELLFDIRSIRLQNSFLMDLGLFCRHVVAHLILIAFFYFFTRKLIPTMPEVKANSSLNFLPTIKKNYFVFILSFMCGLYLGFFNFEIVLGSQLVTKEYITNYQWASLAGGIIIPFLVGVLADKIGIFLVCSFSIIFITLLQMTDVSLLLSNKQFLYVYMVTTFFQSGFTISIVAFNASLIGERMKFNGIFRIFAISNLISQMGSIVNSNVMFYFNNVVQYKTVICIISLIPTWFFIVAYRKTVR